MIKKTSHMPQDWVIVAFWQDETYYGQLVKVPAERGDEWALRVYDQHYDGKLAIEDEERDPSDGLYFKVNSGRYHVPGRLVTFPTYLYMREADRPGRILDAVLDPSRLLPARPKV